MTNFSWIETHEAVIIGGGAAGLTTALSAAPMKALVLVQGDDYLHGSTAHAQGGIASPTDDEDVLLHGRDTLKSAAGSAIPEAVSILVKEGHAAVAWVAKHGLVWDVRPDGKVLLGREGAHSKNRILHAGGDATGRHVSETLYHAAKKSPYLELRYRARVVQITQDEFGISGLVVHWEKHGLGFIHTRKIVLATGGYGGLFRPTTSPALSTGEGLFLAAELGCPLQDLEMIQFHPTALDVPGDRSLHLLTEALRGAGARLVMVDGTDLPINHPQGPLGPRDIVARAIFEQKSKGLSVFLDARGVSNAETRFPTVSVFTQAFGLMLSRDLIPVTPAAHYTMGGVAVDLNSQTPIPGLWVVGEAASNGIHGANRLASNSLLECLVFGRRAGKTLKSTRNLKYPSSQLPPGKMVYSIKEADPSALDALGTLLFYYAGPVRTETQLNLGIQALNAWMVQWLDSKKQNLTLKRAFHLSLGIFESALARTESRGAHFRLDYPDSDPAWARLNSWKYAFSDPLSFIGKARNIA